MAVKKQKMGGNNPAVIDLFAGAGGLSLGAARAGFDLNGAVELDERAMQTHQTNFPATVHFETDVAALTGRTLLRDAGLTSGELVGLIGGPPCQGFSILGQKQKRDPRNEMFSHFMRLVRESRPAFFLAENVPGILDPRHSRLIKSALDILPRSYRVLEPFQVCASDFGAATKRSRVIFFGYDPSRVNDLEQQDFADAQVDSLNVTNVRTALHGLPMDIEPSWIDEKDSWRRIEISKSGLFFDRVANNVPHKVGDPEALDRYFSKKQAQGNFGTRHSLPIVRRYGALAYGEEDPITRSVRLDPKGWCPTLRAGTGPERGSFQAVRPIHYLRPRVITPREAARLQGFPDWFKFDRTKWHSFRQIGNSVSPLVAEALLTVIRRALNR
jgi:DNA (cytosine-5)-methyltransferase 1